YRRHAISLLESPHRPLDVISGRGPGADAHPDDLPALEHRTANPAFAQLLDVRECLRRKGILLAAHEHLVKNDLIDNAKSIDTPQCRRKLDRPGTEHVDKLSHARPAQVLHRRPQLDDPRPSR